MKVMSFNILCAGGGENWWETRIPRVLETIRGNDPDTLGVQEAHLGWMNALREGLPEYDSVGVGRNDGKDDGEFSAVFYKRDKFTALDSGTFWLSETPEVPSIGWDACCIRICSWALLEETASGRRFVHMNTHLDHVGRQAQLRGASLVAERAKAICGDAAAFFTGDFNVTPDSEPYRTVIAGGFADSRLVASSTDSEITFHGFGTSGEEPCIIDYVFVRGDVMVDTYRVETTLVDGKFPSDHYPVVVDCRW